MSRAADQRISNLRDRAIEHLRKNGVKFANAHRQIKNVVSEIERYTGEKCSGDMQIYVERFVRAEDAKKCLPEPLKSKGTYTYSPAMRENLRRAAERGGFNPISMNSKVRDYVDFGR